MQQFSSSNIYHVMPKHFNMFGCSNSNAFSASVTNSWILQILYDLGTLMTTGISFPGVRFLNLPLKCELCMFELRLRSCRVTRGYLPGNRRRYRSGAGQVRSITWSLPATWLENHAFSHFLLVWLWNEAVYNVLPLQCPPHYWKLLLEIIQFPF